MALRVPVDKAGPMPGAAHGVSTRAQPQKGRAAAHFQHCSREPWGWTLSFWGQRSLVKALRKL